MKLRDHPLMSYRSVPNWPPVWTCGYEAEKKITKGEVGNLKHVMRVGGMPYTCFLIIDYQGVRYVGSLLFDDVRFCTQIYNVLDARVGSSIADIGDLDVSHTL
jgi:hypothetical protein